jgi:acyl carrier protein
MDRAEQAIHKIFQQIFRQPNLVLGPNMEPKDIKGWDSMTQVRIIVAVEKELGIKFKASEVVNIKCVGDFYTKANEKLQAQV